MIHFDFRLIDLQDISSAKMEETKKSMDLTFLKIFQKTNGMNIEFIIT